MILQTESILDVMPVRNFEQRSEAWPPVSFTNYRYDSERVVLTGESGSDGHPAYTLTLKEFDLLKVICAAPASTKEMAARLGVSHSTVKHRLDGIYLALGMASRAGEGDGGDLDTKRIRLIGKLADEGFLQYGSGVNEG